MSDSELLQRYIEAASETAFTELVNRYVSFVYSIAHRRVSDPQLAEEIAQKVFCLLARKAAGLAKRTTLAGWLYRTTCFVAAKTQRAEMRRRRHEEEALSMNENEKTGEDIWKNLSPMLEDGMIQLSEGDRLALLLRFFQHKPMAEVGDALGITEAAAKMRIGRAVQRLREFFAKRGTACSIGGLSALLAERTVDAAPAALTGKILAVVSTEIGVSAGATFLASVFGKSLVFGSVASIGIGMAIYFHSVAKNSGREIKDNINQPTISNHQIGANSQMAEMAPSASAAKGDSIDTNLDAAIAHLRLVLHTRPMTHHIYDYEGITNAIDAFGDKKIAAFEVLRETSTDPTAFVREGAYSGMGYVGRVASGAAPVLWNDFYTASSSIDRSIILRALQHIGLGTWDLPQLTSLLADPMTESNILTKYVPESISSIIDNNPVAAKPYLGAIENLLDDPNPDTQFRAALALVKSEGTDNPKISSAIHLLFQRPNDRLGEYYKGLAVQILGEAGPGARLLVPDMLAFAKSADDAGYQDAAYQAIASVEPDLAVEDPRIAKALQEQEENQMWTNKWNSGSYTLDDLRAALTNPRQSLTAANHLAQMGPEAESTVPDMVRALWGQDPDTRNLILADIYKIDPQTAVTKINMAKIITGNVHDVLDQEPNTPQNQLLKEDLIALEFSDWCLPEELAAFTNKLAAENPKAYQAYVQSNK